jgi:hypothetical protein
VVIEQAYFRNEEKQANVTCLLSIKCVTSTNILLHIQILGTRSGSVVGMTGYGLDDRGVGVPSPGRVKNSNFYIPSRSALGSIRPPIQWGLGALSPGIKWPRREADHSPPTRADVKKAWIYTTTSPYSA